MARGFDQKRGRSPSIPDRQQQAAAARDSALARYKQAFVDRAEKTEREEKEKTSNPLRNIPLILDGLSRIPFLQLDRPGKLHPSEPYRKLASLALEAINTNSRRAALCWPVSAASPAAIVAMLMMADCDTSDPIQVGGNAALSAPWGLRAIVFPYARTVHRALRHIYVDKSYVHNVQLKHQVRSIYSSTEDAALADFHKTLSRVGDLTGRTKDGALVPEFAHPCLDELLPSGPCNGQGTASELLWRVRTKTVLKDIKRSNTADDPKLAKFYLFGISANENAEDQLKALKPPPTLIILQLDSVGRRRLGRHWEGRTKTFLSAVDSRIGNVPLLAITDDPWTFDRLRFDTLFRQPKRRKEPPCPSQVIFSTQTEILAEADPPAVEYAPIKNCSAIAYAGEIEELLRRLRTDRADALRLGDSENGDRLSQLIGTIRRCTALPGSRAELARYLEEQCGPMAAAELMSPYRVGRVTSELRESYGAWPQVARDELEAICTSVHDVWDRTDQLTPMKSLLRDLVSARFLQNSSRTVLLFPNDMLADFAAHALTEDYEIGHRVKGRIENSMIRFLDRYALEDLDALPKPARNHIKTLVVVSPPRAAMLELLAKPWLPENVIVLGDADTLACAASDAKRLGSYPDLNPLKLRFEAFASKASEAASRVHGTAVSLESNIEHHDDAEASTSRIVNLAGAVRENQLLYRIELKGGTSGGQILIAKPGSNVVIQDNREVLPVYKEVEARELAEGDRVCVIGDAFVEMARPLVNITKRAAEEIRDYHNEVQKRFAGIAGDNHQARLRSLIAKMGIDGVGTQKAAYWVDLDEQLAATLDDVVPHAPRDYSTFVAFMRALGISGPIVERYWLWAVIAQRSHKLQAGMGIRDAYRGILVDSYSAEADNPTRIQDFRRLRAAAENFVGVIQKIDTFKAENART